MKLNRHDLMVDELGFLVSPLYPWSRAGKVDRRQLADQRMVLCSRMGETFRLVDQFFIRSGAPLREWTELRFDRGDQGTGQAGSRRQHHRPMDRTAEQTFIGLCQTVAKDLVGMS